MKHYQRVSLKSPLFRQNKTKSPLHKVKQSNSIDPIDLFQKVCCPNCRYMFKVIKKDQPKENMILNTVRKIQADTQTYDKHFQLPQPSRIPKMIQNIKQQTNRAKNNISIYDLGNTRKTQIPQLSFSAFKDSRLYTEKNIKDLSLTKRTVSPRQGQKNNCNVLEKKFQKPAVTKRINEVEVKQQIINNQKIKIAELIKIQQQIYLEKIERQHFAIQNNQYREFILDLPRQFGLPSYLKMMVQQLEQSL